MNKILKFTMALLFIFSVFILINYNFQNKVPKANINVEYKIDLKNALSFLKNNMINNEGGIYTNYLNYNESKSYATGHEVLAESQGLMMLHAVYNRDFLLFDTSFIYVKNNMFNKQNGLSWRVTNNNSIKTTISASVDDLRVLRALHYAIKLWNKNEHKIMYQHLEKNLRVKSLVNESLVDFYDKSKKSKEITLSYLDLYTMLLLTHSSEKWDNVFNDSLRIIKMAKVSKDFPLYYKTYSNDHIVLVNQINMIDSLLTVLHLAEVKEIDYDSIIWLKKELKNNGKIMSSYNPKTGIASKNSYESTAVYAIAMRICNEINEIELYHNLAAKMLELQVKNVNSKVYGGFADEVSLQAYSFDNLQAILALEGR
ncbi:hypothetical protein IMX26_00865 [Clostridium sp. 'deep sea']|uniref:glycosyl hydrolase family 8 n=1 Tax=Clostridium sp. 'deep sea' TaxID=2779445 RepID=UPI00189645FF|nr:glycosyl hydrolase family 8 [Clostridium sp. 'deep sea']QOR35427.1 hypothetical protein IMX26_00865 [Clostridium sp. 'deep sea']